MELMELLHKHLFFFFHNYTFQINIEESPPFHEFHLKKHQIGFGQTPATSDTMLVTIGAAGSTLTSSSVFSVANGLAQVTIHHPSSPSLNHNLSSSDPEMIFTFSLDDYLSHEQSRAALLIMLNKLIISSDSGVTPALLDRIVAILNCDFGALGIGEFQVNAVEFDILKNSTASLLGVFTLIDHDAYSLSAILDVVAALGCEATKADVTPLFDVMDTDDGFSVKEETDVSSHCKILLNGSGHVGQTQVKSVAEIPRLHGCFRRAVASIHSMARVELNTSTKAGSANAVAAAVLPLIRILKILSENAIHRSSLIVKSLESTHQPESTREALTKYEAECPKLSGLKYLYQNMSYYIFTFHHIRFVKEVHNLLEGTIQIVRWEAVLAFVLLRGDSSRKALNIASAADENGESEKAALGKGNEIILQHIRDTFQSDHCNVQEGIFENLDPRNSKFDTFLEKIEETLESNESQKAS